MEDFIFETSFFIEDLLIPCLLAFAFGAVIGFQRERIHRPAGLRTHTLVCLGATAFTIISIHGFNLLAGVDPSRIAAGIVTGIGFIGAGAIFKTTSMVKGVTTAASIWIVAAIGMALGAKQYYLAFILTALGFIVLTLIKVFEDRVIRSGRYIVNIKITSDQFEYDRILEKIKGALKKIKVSREKVDYEDGFVGLRLKVESTDQDFSIKVVERLKDLQYIKKITINQ
jgi:putative Mg2+ transporter-C (MgtC) family protein